MRKHGIYDVGGLFDELQHELTKKSDNTMKRENLQLLKRLVLASVLILVLIRVVSALFLQETRMVVMDIGLPVVLSVAVIFLMLLYGYLKSVTGDKVLGKLNYIAFLLATIGVLLVYIIVTKSAHERQVSALSELIKKLEK